MVPTAVLMFSPVIRNMDQSYEEAAIVSGARVWQTMLRVSLPFLLPTILSTATILMIVGMLAFDVPAVIGMPGNIIVMSAEIFRFMNPPLGIPEYGLSAALNSSLVRGPGDRPGALSEGHAPRRPLRDHQRQGLQGNPLSARPLAVAGLCLRGGLLSSWRWCCRCWR